MTIGELLKILFLTFSVVLLYSCSLTIRKDKSKGEIVNIELKPITKKDR